MNIPSTLLARTTEKTCNSTRDGSNKKNIKSSISTIICFSHLRWDFVLQRPQHMMRRFARDRKLYFFEEFIPCDHPLPYLEFHPFPAEGVIALRPRIPHWWDAAARAQGLRELVDMLVGQDSPPLLWFYSPMMFDFAGHLAASSVVYDCMDELSAFRFADPALPRLEAALIERADVMFAGGRALFEAKRDRHPNIHLLPSAVDLDHYGLARHGDLPAPADQAGIAGPRLGFFGVIDERIDLALVEAVARARPDWSILMIGPVVKIDPRDLPRLPNIHWLGSREYARLPEYLAGWDVALMPFAINAATRFISPTKTPEYLAGGCPVVSTPIRDVVRTYGGLAGVRIAGTPEAFIEACEGQIALRHQDAWLGEVDRLLATMTWDGTFERVQVILKEQAHVG